MPGSIEWNGERPKRLLRTAGCSTPHPGILKDMAPACWHTAECLAVHTFMSIDSIGMLAQCLMPDSTHICVH